MMLPTVRIGGKMHIPGRARIHLFGPFRFIGPTGARIEIASRKGVALLAMLALAPDGERTRAWLQDRLWGSRQREQAQNSLRRELSQLRTRFAEHGLPLLSAHGDRVQLNLSLLEVVDDARAGDFLEGIDLPGEDAFEDWLRERRQGSLASADLQVPATFHRTPSLAILPFANHTGDSDQAYIAEGIGEELIERVSRLRWLPVISPGHSFRPDGAESELDAGRRLGAAYVLGGRLRRQGDDYWLAGEIADCATGQVVWSPRVQMPAPQASNAMAPFVASLVAALANRVDDAEQVRARAVPETDLSVNDLIWRGRWHQDRLGREHTEAAGRYFAQAMERAPDSAEAVIEFARHYAYLVWNTRGDDVAFRKIRDLAQRAIILDRQDARGHMLAGMAEMWLRRPDQAEILLERAISLNPSLAIAYEQLGTMHILAGRPERGIESLEIGMRLAPDDYRQFVKYGELALGWLLQGDHARALSHAQQAISLRPSYWHAHVTRINALARSGDLAGARSALIDLEAARPNFSGSYVDWIPFVDRRWHDWLREGLELARHA